MLSRGGASASGNIYYFLFMEQYPTSCSGAVHFLHGRGVFLCYGTQQQDTIVQTVLAPRSH